MESASIRGKVAVVGVGQTTYYKHGKSPEPEFKLALRAILNACSDAGIEATDIDGFASYANDRNDPSRLAAALGVKELRFSNMQWGGGGGGGSGVVANAAAAICAGIADTVVVYRALNQGEYGRFGRGPQLTSIAGDMAFCVPYGIMSPAQIFAMKAMRFMYENGVEQSALRAISLASYHHAQKNPNAVSIRPWCISAPVKPLSTTALCWKKSIHGVTVAPIFDIINNTKTAVTPPGIGPKVNNE